MFFHCFRFLLSHLCNARRGIWCRACHIRSQVEAASPNWPANWLVAAPRGTRTPRAAAPTDMAAAPCVGTRHRFSFPLAQAGQSACSTPANLASQDGCPLPDMYTTESERNARAGRRTTRSTSAPRAGPTFLAVPACERRGGRQVAATNKDDFPLPSRMNGNSQNSR